MFNKKIMMSLILIVINMQAIDQSLDQLTKNIKMFRDQIKLFRSRERVFRSEYVRFNDMAWCGASNPKQCAYFEDQALQALAMADQIKASKKTALANLRQIRLLIGPKKYRELFLVSKNKK